MAPPVKAPPKKDAQTEVKTPSLLDTLNDFDPLGDVCGAMLDLFDGSIFDTTAAKDAVKESSDDRNTDEAPAGRSARGTQPTTVVNNFYGGKRGKALKSKPKPRDDSPEDEAGAEGEGHSAA